MLEEKVKDNLIKEHFDNNHTLLLGEQNLIKYHDESTKVSKVSVFATLLTAIIVSQ